jgi:hypothetical protein
VSVSAVRAWSSREREILASVGSWVSFADSQVGRANLGDRFRACRALDPQRAWRCAASRAPLLAIVRWLVGCIAVGFLSQACTSTSKSTPVNVDAGAGSGGTAGGGGSGGSAGSSFLTGWAYRMSVNIDNSGSAVSGQQLQLSIDAATLVSSGQLTIDGSDLRVSTADNQLLPHWIETALVKDTRIWVKVGVPAGLSRLYLYFGNTAAGDTSDPKSVFQQFDDFDGSSLDASMWSVAIQSGSAAPVISGGQLRLVSAGGGQTFPFDTVQVVGPPLNEPMVIGTSLEVAAAGSNSHTEIVWRASATDHWLNSGRWVYARYHTFSPLPELTFDLSNDSGAQGVSELLGAGQPSTRLYVARDDAGTYDVYVDGEKEHTATSSSAGWASDDAVRPCISSGNNAPGLAYDFRYDWFFAAKPTPSGISVSYGPIEAAP